ncbi:hypothetical protein Misp03_36560 [Microbispora sp. NBRC 16548]|nr:hypothetical protein Misp03_36560 [Microbispora sp. NBRC 16548]
MAAGGMVVVEAAVASGSMNAAAHALHIKRSLAAVPGPLTSSLSTGTHQLIRDGSAVLVTSSDDVIALATIALSAGAGT